MPNCNWIPPFQVLFYIQCNWKKNARNIKKTSPFICSILANQTSRASWNILYKAFNTSSWMWGSMPCPNSRNSLKRKGLVSNNLYYQQFMWDFNNNVLIDYGSVELLVPSHSNRWPKYNTLPSHSHLAPKYLH